jgi:hypothetical protein
MTVLNEGFGDGGKAVGATMLRSQPCVCLDLPRIDASA